MRIPSQAVLLRLYLTESDRWEKNQPLYEAITRAARDNGLSGATVLRGPMGYGSHSQLHTAKILQLSFDMPVIIELIDSEEKIEGFLPILKKMMHGGLATIEQVKVVQFSSLDETS